MAKIQKNAARNEHANIVLCVADAKRVPVRLLTDSIDQLTEMIKKVDEKDIYYIGLRLGKVKNMDDVKTIAVFSRLRNEQIRPKMAALREFEQLYLETKR